jgi:hypothetical protein
MCCASSPRHWREAEPSAGIQRNVAARLPVERRCQHSTVMARHRHPYCQPEPPLTPWQQKCEQLRGACSGGPRSPLVVCAMRQFVIGGHPPDTGDWMCITSYNLEELIAAAGCADGAPAVRTSPRAGFNSYWAVVFRSGSAVSAALAFCWRHASWYTRKAQSSGWRCSEASCAVNDFSGCKCNLITVLTGIADQRDRSRYQTARRLDDQPLGPPWSPRNAYRFCTGVGYHF